MGNALRFFYGSCQRQTAADEPQELGSHGVVTETAGFSALAQDLRLFHTNSRVPPGLSRYVNSSEKAQINWYSKLLKAWNEARTPPKQAEAAARLVIQTLQNIGKANLEGFLAFYGLPVPQTTEEDTDVTPPWAEGVQFELLTLPIDEWAIGDGDGFTAYVSTGEQMESNLIPQEVKNAVIRRHNARAAKDFKQAKLIKKEVIAAGYRFITLPNQKEILAHKYRIRLRGVDAPECKMPYGEEAKQALAKMIKGKCLQIHVYGVDKYGRTVGDVYCNGIFIQELLLRRGCAWHYKAFDARPEFAESEKKARADRRGLWALPNPEEPWVWKKKNPNPRETLQKNPSVYRM
ncbi:uncharacterized 38.1 kDa protein-like [Phalaenopsis equestris]|uniref:uncharacterized 38.1 kDa protein-like n=1 Tax=Phalaenopsis equestris TaxID=78828 RepID=UPI0009E47C7B|nr:uncharacterized 38.1 kDa protein-like [Phalaenopsis equestris]